MYSKQRFEHSRRFNIHQCQTVVVYMMIADYVVNLFYRKMYFSSSIVAYLLNTCLLCNFIRIILDELKILIVSLPTSPNWLLKGASGE